MVQECQLLNARPVASIVLFSDLTTLFNTNLAHAQSLSTWQTGMLNMHDL